GPVTARRAHGVAELVPGEPGAADAGEPPAAPSGDRADARYLVGQRSLPRRRADEALGRMRRRSLALRGDPRREPLDPPRRTRPPERAAARLAALSPGQCAVRRFRGRAERRTGARRYPPGRGDSPPTARCPLLPRTGGSGPPFAGTGTAWRPRGRRRVPVRRR